MNKVDLLKKIEYIDDLLFRAAAECKRVKDNRTEKLLAVAKISLSEMADDIETGKNRIRV